MKNTSKGFTLIEIIIVILTVAVFGSITTTMLANATKVYSSSDLAVMFKNFSSISLRKGGFTFQQIPLIGHLLSRLIGMHTGYSKAGKLIYDKAWRKESSFELLLGRYIGFDYMIKVKK